MGITLNRFQEVMLHSRLDLDHLIYSKSLEFAPKNAWQSFLNWLNNLVRNDGKDQFEMLAVSKSIEDFVQAINPDFYNKISADDIQMGIDNLRALQTKFSKNSEKGRTAAKNLDLPIQTLETALKGIETTSKEKEISKENLEIMDFFSTSEMNNAFKENFSRLSRSYSNCLECFGFDTLKEVYTEQVVKTGITNPEFLLKSAAFRKERLIEHNRTTLKEINAYFNSFDEVLIIFFPEFKENLSELKKKFNEGHLFLDIQNCNWLNEVIKKPESAKRELQQTRYDLFPSLANDPRELEQRRILGGLLNLRNEKAFGECMVPSSRTTQDQPALKVPEPSTPIKIEKQLPPNPDTVEEIKTKASEVIDVAVEETSSVLSFLNNFGQSLINRI